MIDLANATKMAADEAFLAEDLSEADRGYRAVEAILGELRMIPESRAQEISLLREDVRYRRELLRGGFGFWGVLYSTRPLNPVAHFANFTNDVKALAEAVSDLQRLQGELRNLQLAQLRTIAAQERDTAQSRIAALQGQQAEISDQHHQRREVELRARIARVHELQDRLRVQQQEAMAELDQQRNAMNALLMEGVSAALGVPPELAAVANGGDIRFAIVATGTRLLADPEFVASLGEVGEVANLVSDVYAEGQQVVERFSQGVQTAQQLNELVRRPTLEKLTAVGARIYSQLDEPERRRLENAVREIRPIVPLLEFARSNAPVTQAVRGWLADHPAVDRVLLAASLVDEHRDRFADWYTDTMRRVAALDLQGSALERAFDQTLRGWPSAVFDRLPPEAQRLLLRRLGVATKEEALAVLRQRGIELLPVTVSQGTISIPSLGVQLRLQEVVQSIHPAQLPDLTDEFESRVEVGLQQMAAAEQRVLDYGLAQLQAPQLERLVGAVLDRQPDAAAAIFDGILSRSGDGAQPMLQRLAELQAGSAAAADPGISARTPADPPGSFQPPAAPAQQAGGVDALRAALGGPLGGVFPQAKVAQIAVSWVAGNAAMLSTIDRINRISAQMERFVLEEIHLRDAVEEAEYRQEMALLEQRVADERRRMSVNSAQRNYEQISQVTETAETLRNRIINAYRVANIFYLAERVRFQFDSLNRALRTWTASYDQPSDFVRAQTYASPNQLRFALDPQIRLFDLISNPDLERQRLDLDRLVQSWSLIQQVAEELCRGIGCSGGNPAIGKVDFTPTYLLSDILSEVEMQDLRTWQRRRQPNLPFRAAFLIHPSGVGRVNQAPADGRRGVRVVDVGVTTMQAAGRSEQSLVRLTHPGVAYVEGVGGFYTETLIAARAIGGRPQVGELRNSQDYAQRWAQRGGHTLAPLEGYALFTEWILEFPANTQNWSLEDVQLRFVYQYQDTAPATEAQAREALLSGTLLPISLSGEQISTVGTWQELERKIIRWMRDDPPWRHGALVSERTAWMTEPSTLRRNFGEWVRR